jgi:hypothetical protein
MPNILKRPMFSRGGASQGTGVTSGLGRQNFEEKGSAQTTPNPALDDKKAMIDYVSQLKRQAQPTTTQRIGDFLTAFGASADPTRVQTVAEALGGAARGYTALSQKRDERADKYGAVLDSQLLKMFGSDAKVTAAMTNAKEFARVNFKKFPGKTDKEKYNAAYASKFNELLSKERAQTSTIELVRERDNQIKKTEIFPPDFNTRPIAETQILIEQGKVKGVPSYAGVMRIDDIIIEGDGTVATPNTKKPGYPGNFRRYRTNEFYIANDGSVYQYQGSKGKGTFKRVYP